jgi:hypothetical protein
MEPVAKLVRLDQVLTHRPHPRCELADPAEQRHAVQLPEHLVPIRDRIDPAQRPQEKRLRVVLIAPRRDRFDDLVEIQVPEETRLASLADARTVV